jgi:hypothetical protein
VAGLYGRAVFHPMGAGVHKVFLGPGRRKLLDCGAPYFIMRGFVSLSVEIWSLVYLLLVVGGTLGIIGLFLGDDGKRHLIVTDEGWGRPGFVHITVGGAIRLVGFFIFGAGVLSLLYLVLSAL